MNRPLYEESRRALCDKISANIQSAGSIVRQVVKGSRTGDILSASARNFAAVEQNINTTESNLLKAQLTQKQFHQQLDNVSRTLDDNRDKIVIKYQ